MTKLNPHKKIDAAARAYEREADLWISRDSRWVNDIRAFEVCRMTPTGANGVFSETHRFQTDHACERALVRLRGRAAIQAALRAIGITP